MDLEKTRELLKKAKEADVSLDEEIDEQKSMHNFKLRKKDYIKKSLLKEIRNLKKYLNKEYSEKLDSAGSIDELEKVLNEIEKADIRPQKIEFITPPLPSEIQGEVEADIREIKKCFEHGLNRSAVILCGRVLEVALHRRYYDITGNDILETSPGIGLGKLIAKLKERRVKFPPGITQQIHLINQIRIRSVHKKSTPFYPSDEQTQAIILYTLDILKKLV